MVTNVDAATKNVYLTCNICTTKMRGLTLHSREEYRHEILLHKNFAHTNSIVTASSSRYCESPKQFVLSVMLMHWFDSSWSVGLSGFHMAEYSAAHVASKWLRYNARKIKFSIPNL